MPDKENIYRGRFAPSPTGQVHFGTLVAAVGSYLQAKKNNGEWLLRIDDVDTTRSIPGADKDLLNTLEAFSFEWDGEVIYQSQQTAHYQEALEKLTSLGLTFPCICSRKELATIDSKIYPGTCRQRCFPEDKEHAIRLLAKETKVLFNDLVMGEQSQNIQQQCGDFVIKRRDHLFAYQLAVVVDDFMQNISEVVRGADLLDSTPRQIYIQQLLNYKPPRYCHLPLAVDADGNKISKSAGATAIKSNNKEKHLVDALEFLGQNPSDDLHLSNITEIWRWAINHWQIDQVPNQEKQSFKLD